MEPRCLTFFQFKWEKKLLISIFYPFVPPQGLGGCKQIKNCFWGLKIPEADFSHPFDHSWLSHTKNFSMHVVPALTRPQRFQRMKGKAHSNTTAHTRKQKLGGTRRHLFYFAGLPGLEERRKLSFLMAPASYFHNLPNSMAEMVNKFLILPEIPCLISSGYLLALQNAKFCQQNTTALLPT